MNVKETGGESLTTESFLFVCKRCGLTMADLEVMDIGDVLDYIETYIDEMTPENQKVREATQADFDSF